MVGDVFSLPTAGQRGNGHGKPVDADDVYLRWMGDGRVGRIRIWRVCVCMGVQRSTGVEVVETFRVQIQAWIFLPVGRGSDEVQYCTVLLQTVDSEKST